MKTVTCFVYVGLVSMCWATLAHGTSTDDVRAFTQGQKIKYNCISHPKAKGVNVTVEYPSTWHASEGQRPNIVQKFSGKDISGNLVQAILSIKDLGFLARFAKDEMLKDDFLREMVTDMGGLYERSGTTKIDGENAAWVIHTQDIDNASMKMRMKSLMFVVMYKGKNVQLQCAVGALRNDSTLDARFNDYLPVFQLIGNSIVFPDKWK